MCISVPVRVASSTGRGQRGREEFVESWLSYKIVGKGRRNVKRPTQTVKIQTSKRRNNSIVRGNTCQPFQSTDFSRSRKSSVVYLCPNGLVRVSSQNLNSSFKGFRDAARALGGFVRLRASGISETVTGVSPQYLEEASRPVGGPAKDSERAKLDLYVLSSDTSSLGRLRARRAGHLSLL